MYNKGMRGPKKGTVGGKYDTGHQGPTSAGEGFWGGLHTFAGERRLFRG